MKPSTTSIIVASLLSLAAAPVLAAPIIQEELPIAGDSSKSKMGGMKHGGNKMGGMDHGNGGGKKKGCSMMNGKKDGMEHGGKKKGGMSHGGDKKAGMKKHQKKMETKLNRINERLEVIETMLQQLLNRKK